MTAISHSRAASRGRGATPEPPRLNLHLVTILLAILGQAAAGIWFASALERRVTGIEQEVPPGAIARLDERTALILKAMDRLESKP
jgi:hypothetical protein